jgi:subtilisin family serine protease
MDYGYNTDFDPREELVGDNYEDAYEKYYGNNQVYINEEFSSHGTHVAGIIAANRDNDIGAKGICANAKIMVLRCVPDGDERDKDVANSIIYAVDNGAKIINMSFGKGYAHSSEAVKAAIKYAQENNVLLIHAAGNDSENNDETDNFPNDFDGSYQDVWIEVGASSWYEKPDMLASFSNYGRAEVDVFAPGVAIYSTMPDSAYEALDGTSMASPVVAGVAAYVWSYYPDLSAEELRDILVESTEYLKRRQKIPGSKKKRKLKKLSASGGIINLANAMELAALRSSGQ